MDWNRERPKTELFSSLIVMGASAGRENKRPYALYLIIKA